MTELRVVFHLTGKRRERERERETDRQTDREIERERERERERELLFRVFEFLSCSSYKP